MKILITAPNLDENRNVSGISTIVRQIIEYCPDEFLHFVAGREDGESSGLFWAIRQLILPFRFVRQILRFRPDVIHINTALTDLSIMRDAILLAAARSTRTPVILAIHGGKYLIEDIPSKTMRFTTKRLLGMADSIVVYSDHEKDLIEERWAPNNIFILPNAIPARFIEKVQRSNDRPSILYFGRMHESKGLQELINAVRVIRKEGLDFDVRAYGEGPLREYFVTEMVSLLDDRFLYGGVIRGNEKWNIMREADIFVLPSRYGEGLPMAMLEAMATGCVVIVGNVASVRTVIEDGKNGFLVQPFSEAELVQKLKQTIRGEFDIEDIGLKAIKTVREHFEIGQYVQRLRSIYVNTING